MNFWPSDIFSEIADWCGIFGLILSFVSVGLTLYLTVTANRIKQQFRRRDLLPEQQKAVVEHCERLHYLLENYTASELAIIGEIGSIEATLDAIRLNLHKSETVSVDEALQSAADYKKGPSRAALGRLYSKMTKLIGEIGYRVSEMPWQ